MAGFDYVSCKECGKRLFFDGGRVTQRDMSRMGTVGLTCDHCVKKLKKKLKKAVKYDKRKR